jgi:hypothetical protein
MHFIKSKGPLAEKVNGTYVACDNQPCEGTLAILVFGHEDVNWTTYKYMVAAMFKNRSHTREDIVMSFHENTEALADLHNVLLGIDATTEFDMIDDEKVHVLIEFDEDLEDGAEDEVFVWMVKSTVTPYEH